MHGTHQRVPSFWLRVSSHSAPAFSACLRGSAWKKRSQKALLAEPKESGLDSDEQKREKAAARESETYSKRPADRFFFLPLFGATWSKGPRTVLPSLRINSMRWHLTGSRSFERKLSFQVPPHRCYVSGWEGRLFDFQVLWAAEICSRSSSGLLLFVGSPYRRPLAACLHHGHMRTSRKDGPPGNW